MEHPPLVRTAPCYPKQGPIRTAVTYSRASALARGVALQFFSKNRHTQGAGLHPLYQTELQNLNDFVEPCFDGMSSDLRFDGLLRSMNFPP